MLRPLIITLLGFLIFFANGCGTETNPDSEDKPFKVVATIYPLADIAGQLGYDLVQVDYLLPPGASPHTFEPTVEQARQISEADLFLFIGAGLDEWAVKLAGESGSGPLIVDLSQFVPLIDAAEYYKTDGQAVDGAEHGYEHEEEDATEAGHNSDHDHEHGPEDPHYWLDPLIVREYLAPAIAAALEQVGPQHTSIFNDNLEKYKGELTELDSLIREELTNMPGRYFITFHSAWRYFAVRYDLEEIAVIAHFPGQEPSAGWLADLVELIQVHQISAIYAEPQFSAALADRIAEESGIEVLMLDPLGGVEGRLTYLEIMRYNLEMFLQGLAE